MALKIKISLILLIFGGSIHAQYKKWILGVSEHPFAGTTSSFVAASTNVLKFWEVDFSGGTPIASQRVTGTSVNSIYSIGTNEAINFAANKNGDIDFYVFANPVLPYNYGWSATTNGDDIYFVAFDSLTMADEVIGSVFLFSGGASSVKNIEIIPYQFDNKKYFVIFKTACLNSQPSDYLYYVTVDMNTRTVSSVSTIDYSSLNEGVAVTPLKCGNSKRYIYYVKYLIDLHIYKVLIDGDVIYPPTLEYISTIPFNGSGGQGDIDVSPDGTKLAIANLTGSTLTKDLIILDIDPITGALSNERYFDNPSNYIFSVEFSPNSQRVYATRGGTGAVTSEVYNLSVPPISGAYTISSSDVAVTSMTTGEALEIGIDGKLYYTTDAFMNKLCFISNPNNPPPNTIATTSSTFFGIGNGVSNTIPDMIDGDVYSSGISIIGDSTICSGDSTLLTALTLPFCDSVFWSGAIIDTNIYIMVSPTINSTYIATIFNSTCIISDTFTINVYPIPVIITSQNDSICSGASISLSVSGANAYNWSGGISSTDSIVNVSPATTTNYFVIGSNSSCSSLPDTVTVTVVTNPNVNISGPTSICLGDSTLLVASGASSITWSGGISSTNDSITVSPSINTTYIVSSSGSCVVNDTITVNVYPIPVIITSQNDSICSGESISLSVSGANAYNWSGGVSSSDSIIYVSPTSTTNYFVIGSNSSCSSLPDTVTVTVVTNPNVNISGPTSICLGDSTTLSVSSPFPIQWSGGSSSTSSSITVSPLVNTQFIATATNIFCSDSDTVIVLVSPYQQANFTYEQDICSGEFLFSSNSGPFSFDWSLGDSAAFGQSVYFAFADTGFFQIQLIVNAGSQCADTLVQQVHNQIFWNPNEPFIPNIFTPNNDGINDKFIVKGLCNYDKLVIFDRWGVKIFETDNPQFDFWDGKFKNENAVQGVYYYIFTYKGSEMLKGHLTLSR